MLRTRLAILSVLTIAPAFAQDPTTPESTWPWKPRESYTVEVTREEECHILGEFRCWDVSRTVVEVELTPREGGGSTIRWAPGETSTRRWDAGSATRHTSRLPRQWETAPSPPDRSPLDITLDAQGTILGTQIDAESLSEPSLFLLASGRTLPAAGGLVAEPVLQPEGEGPPGGYFVDRIEPVAGEMTLTWRAISGDDAEAETTDETFASEIAVEVDPATGWPLSVLWTRTTESDHRTTRIGRLRFTTLPGGGAFGVTALPLLRRALRLGAAGAPVAAPTFERSLELELSTDVSAVRDMCPRPGEGIDRAAFLSIAGTFAPEDTGLVLCADVNLDRFLRSAFDAAGPRFQAGLERWLPELQWDSKDAVIEGLGELFDDRVLVIVREKDEPDPGLTPPNDGRVTDAWCVVLRIPRMYGERRRLDYLQHWIGMRPEAWGLRGRDGAEITVRRWKWPTFGLRYREWGPWDGIETGYWEGRVGTRWTREYWHPGIQGTGHLCTAVVDRFLLVSNSITTLQRVVRVADTVEGAQHSLLHRDDFRTAVEGGPERAGLFLWADRSMLSAVRGDFAREVGGLFGTDPIPALLDRDRYLTARTGLLVTWRVDDEGRARLTLNGLDPE